MNMSPTAVFRAKDPQEVQRWEDERAERWEAYSNHFKAMQQKYGQTLTIWKAWPLSMGITGYIPERWNDEPQPGFRHDSKTRAMIPAKRTPEGKEVAKELVKHSYRRRQPPGTDEMVFGDGRMQPWQFTKVGDDWYAYLTMPLKNGDVRPYGPNPGGVIVGDIDLDLWDQVKLSEWHALLEEQAVAQ